MTGPAEGADLVALELRPMRLPGSRITLAKTAAVAVVIGVFYLTGIY